MSHRTWFTLALSLPLAAGAAAQDQSGGFGDELFEPKTAVAGQIIAFEPVVPADLDEDGLPDIACLDNPTGKLAVFLSELGIGLGRKTLVPTGLVTFFTSTHMADIDADGHVDLVLNSAAQLWWMRGHGDGSFDAPAIGGPGPGFVKLLATDLNADGFADLLSATTQLQLRTGDGAGGFSAPTQLGAVVLPTHYLASDLDDDGVLDIALLDQGKVKVLKGLGAGAFAAPQAFGLEAWNGLAVADMDVDGTLDLVHGSKSNVATVLHGAGDLQYGAPMVVSLQPKLRDVTAADLELDGVPDLLGASEFNDAPPTLVARRMSPTGPVGPAHVAPLGLNGMDTGIDTADFDGDGLLDVLAQSAGDQQVGIVLNGLGWFIGLGHELASPQGTPTLEPHGTPMFGSLLTLTVNGPSQPSVGFLFAGLQPANVPFAGGVFVPDARVTVGIPVSGHEDFNGMWPAGIPAGTTIYLQAWFKTPTSLAASDALLIVSG